MIVVSDTSPLNYLILLESVHVLPAVFGRVYAPAAVIKELSHGRSPEAVRAWASSPPAWLIVQDPTHTARLPKLGAGETAAISLALELKADRILIDERNATREANRSGLTVVGTLGVLEDAAIRGLIDIEQKIEELKATTFRASERLYQSVRDRVREQKLAQEKDRQAKHPKRRRKTDRGEPEHEP